MLDVRNLNVFYGNIHVLRDVSLVINDQDIVALVGRNGAGKSTLVSTVSGIVTPRTGSIIFNGINIVGLSADEIVKLGIVQCPEGRGIFQRFTVDENLEIGAYIVKDPKQIEKRKDLVYSFFPVLAERRRQIAGTLSGGEAQMLGIGKALMAGPRLLLLDEPASGLAPKVALQILEIIRAINSEGVSILLVDENATRGLRVSRRGYVLEVGKVEKEGYSKELLGDQSIQKAYLGVIQ